MMVSTPIILTGCSGSSGNTDQEDNIVTLKTDFNAESPSYSDYFDRVETIPRNQRFKSYRGGNKNTCSKRPDRGVGY